MKALLDTHTFLWWVTNNSQLSPYVRDIITDVANTIVISAVSGWEMAIKVRSGKLTLAEDLERFVQDQVVLNNFTILPIHLHHALYVSQLPLYHRDPFDRLLIAQSLIENLPLLSIDPLIRQYAVQTIW